MRGEVLTGSFGLVSTLVLFPDYCLVYVVGISADCSIHPGAGTELVDHGPPELEGRRGRTPYGQDPGRRRQTCLRSHYTCGKRAQTERTCYVLSTLGG